MEAFIPNELLAVAALVLTLAIIGTRFAFRFGIPVILLFIAAGMFGGASRSSGVAFDDYLLAYAVGVFALVIILFDGGFHTEPELIRGGLRSGVILAIAGTIGTALLVAAFLVSVSDFGWLQGLLVGTIIAPTDAAAVFATLRKQRLVLKQNLRVILEIESGMNDPPAIYLTIALVAVLLGDMHFGTPILWGFAAQMALGALLGYAGGRVSVWVLRHVQLEAQALYPLLALSLAIFVFSVANLLGGSGFMAVYVAGIMVGASRLSQKFIISRFHDGFSWLMQIVVFATLGLLVSVTHLVDVAFTGVLLGMFFLLVARPLVVSASLARSGLVVRERLLISWCGLRGAVPIILAIYPLLLGVPRAEEIFNMVVLVVLLSILVQGSTVGRMAKLLRVGLWTPPGKGVVLGGTP